MAAVIERPPVIYALEPLEELCEECRQHPAMHVIVLPPAVVRARAPRPLHASVFAPWESEEDDLANATWEDAEWQ